MSKFLFVVGSPGAGKTTFIRGCLLERDPYLTPKPKWTVGERVIAAGHYTGGTFDGADTVPYNGVKEALAFWDREFAKKVLTIFDGDRFSYGDVHGWAQQRGEARALCLRATPELLMARRAARGSNQNPQWMKGRETKAVKFFSRFDPSCCFEADVSLTDDLARVQREILVWLEG